MTEHHEKSLFPFSLILLIVLIISGGIFHFYSPRETMRPSFSEKEIEEYKGEEKILSRLWQDPFQAVEKYIKDLKTKQKDFRIPNILNEWENSAIFQNHSNNNLSTLQEDLPIYEDNNTKNNHLLILPVIINTGTYVEDFEERLRTRYAVLSAFHVAGYIPEDADHIGVFKYTIQGDEKYVPFEWLKKDTHTLREKSPPYDMALIIWVGDKYFGIQPDTIEDLIDRVKDLLKPNYCACFIIDSTTLSFVQYLKQSQKTQSQEKNNKNNLYYTRAYVNPHIPINKTPGLLSIPDIIKKLSEPPKSPTFFLSKTPFHYRHTELDTIQLTDALVKELDNRNINLKSAGLDHIVLISDWDTYYRRDLPLSFAISVQNYRNEKKEDRTNTKK